MTENLFTSKQQGKKYDFHNKINIFYCKDYRVMAIKILHSEFLFHMEILKNMETR